MPELKLYTVAQLQSWLMNNQPVEGLSERIISRARAWAIAHNPYVIEDDPVVAAILEDGEMVAYTSAFPELLEEKRYWWFTSLWCDPKHQGKGYGLIVIGSLVEVYGVEHILDRWGAEETVEIFKCIGLNTANTTRYMLGVKVDKSTYKGKFVHFIRTTQKYLHRLIERPLKREEYALRYLPYIDDATYDFILAHRNHDYFFHTQEFMNWIMQYPFSISAPLIERVLDKMPFSSSETLASQLYAVQVTRDEAIIGFYLMKRNVDSLHILYLYFDDLYKIQVFASVRDHVQRMQIAQCVTENKELADYLLQQIYFPKFTVCEVSFSAYALGDLRDKQLQYGDGDCFTA